MSYVDDLACIICTDLFEKPVTVICGHTFCNSCIVQTLRLNPKCPICKYPILGFQKLNTNIAIQTIVELFQKQNPESENKKRKLSHFAEKNELANLKAKSWNFGLEDEKVDEITQEILQKDVNLSTIELSEVDVKCIGFQLKKRENFRYFIGTSYELEIEYPHSDELFKLLIPDHYFIGFNKPKNHVFKKQIKSEKKWEIGFLFLIEKIVKFSISTVQVIARCKGHLSSIEKSPLDFSGHKEVMKMVNDVSEPVVLNFVSGRQIMLKQPVFIEAQFRKKLAVIELQICHFLNTLKETNESIAEQFIIRYAADSFGKKMSVDWNQDVHGFLNAVGSMLNLPAEKRKVVSQHFNYQFRTNVIYDFLTSASFESDPIFFLNYELKNSISYFWTHLGFLLAVILYIVSVFYPQYMLWEFK